MLFHPIPVFKLCVICYGLDSFFVNIIFYQCFCGGYLYTIINKFI